MIAETDVLVVGSGPGGLAAALASAREGVDTMLVERFGCFGGNITAVGVEGIAWYRKEGTVDTEGIGIEFEQRAKSMGATSPEPQSKSEAINADMFKHVADVMVQEAGNRPLLHSVVIDTIIEDDQIKGVIIADDERGTVPPPTPPRQHISLPSAATVVTWIGKALLGLIMVAGIIALLAGAVVLAPFLLLGALSKGGPYYDLDYDPKLIILVDGGNGDTVWISLFTWYE